MIPPLDTFPLAAGTTGCHLRVHFLLFFIQNLSELWPEQPARLSLQMIGWEARRMTGRLLISLGGRGLCPILDTSLCVQITTL